MLKNRGFRHFVWRLTTPPGLARAARFVAALITFQSQFDGYPCGKARGDMLIAALQDSATRGESEAYSI
jgi:hypothetical protein